MRFEVLMVGDNKTTAFRDVTQCSWVDGYQRFGGICASTSKVEDVFLS
jgi:hypothetical protein